MVGLALGWILAVAFGAQRRQVRREQALREAERAESDKAMARSRLEMQELVNKANEHSLLLQFLPDLIRQIFTASGQRSVAPLALNLIEQLFHPEQAAIFMARPSHQHVALAVGVGLPATLSAGAEVEIGKGRIGFAAEHQTSMDEADFRMAPGDKAARSFDAKKRLEASGLHGVRADVVAPILDGLELLGVLSMAGPRTRIGQEKRLLTMVSDLTAVALVHANRLRATEESTNLDGLTGAHNKPYLMQQLGKAIAQAEGDGSSLSILMLDIDHFQHYNRTNGHMQGDEVLRKLAGLVKASLRDTDVVARYAGEEFVVIYIGAGKELAMRLGEKLRESVEAFPFPHRGHQPLGAVTISGGVASFPEDSRRAEHLIRCADQALYEAKAAGRNRIFPGEPNFLA